MANSLLRLPHSLRAFSVSASSNGSPGGVQSGGPMILELPVDKIRRPLMRTRANDPQKVKELMDSIAEIGLQVPSMVMHRDYRTYYHRCNRAENSKCFTISAFLCEVLMRNFLFLRPMQIDVLEVDDEYYGFSGCHRYEAHQRLGLPTIRCKVRRGTKETLRHHLL